VRAPVRLSITNFPGPTHRGSPNDHGKQGPCLSARFLARKPWLTRGASTRVGRLRGHAWLQAGPRLAQRCLRIEPCSPAVGHACHDAN